MATAHLPVQLSSFVGRDSQMTQLRAMPAEHRLITLTGAGGVGKTRLAVLTDDNGSNVQDQGTAGPYQVPAGDTFTGYLNDLGYSQFGYHNGPVNFTWNGSNVQQTG